MNDKKIKLIALAVIVLLSGIIIANNLLSKRVILKTEEVTVELGENFNLEVDELFKGKVANLAKVTLDDTAVDTDKVGEYKVVAKFGAKEYEITVKVVDTTKPDVELESRVVFTNDLTKELQWQDFANVYELSDTVVCRMESFEKVDALATIGENELSALVHRLETDDLMTEEEIANYLKDASKEIPTEEGIYHCVVSFKDASENTSYEQLVVVYDTTPAAIGFDNNETIEETVDEETFSNPSIDLSGFTLVDNVDGVISSENYETTWTATDSENGKWELTLSYTDRAGNKAEHVVYVELTIDENIVNTPSDNDSGSSSGGSSGGSSSGSSGGSSGGVSSGSGSGSMSGDEYPPEIWDTNGDGYVSWEEKHDLNHDGYIDGAESCYYQSLLDMFIMEQTNAGNVNMVHEWVHPEENEVYYILISDNKEFVIPDENGGLVYDTNDYNMNGRTDDYIGITTIQEFFDPDYVPTGPRFKKIYYMLDEYLLNLGLYTTREENGDTWNIHDFTDEYYAWYVKGSWTRPVSDLVD